MALRFRVALAAALALAPASAVRAGQAGEWRLTGTGGDIAVEVSAEEGAEGPVTLRLACGPRPSVRLRGPVAGARPSARAESRSVSFAAGEDLFVAALDASFVAVAPDPRAPLATPERVDMVAERARIEEGDTAAIRDLVLFLIAADAPAVTLGGGPPPFAFTLPLAGAREPLRRFLEDCQALAAP